MALKLPLSLDYGCVLSAWEKMGGNIYASDSDDAAVPDLQTITLDLSSWEASLNPTPKVVDACGAGLFSAPYNWFMPADLGATYQPPSAVNTNKDTQVVPQMPGGLQPSDSESAASDMKVPQAGVKAETSLLELGPASSPSLSSNSDAVVPDMGFNSTATSSCSFGTVPQAVPQQQAPMALAPQPSLPKPVQQQTQPVDGEPVFVRTRAECLERYREKKARRLYTKKIRYQLRKINADKRPRIKGRFVKKEELEEYLKNHKSGSVSDDEDEEMEDIDGFESDDE